jgi:hypothetical protein
MGLKRGVGIDLLGMHSSICLFHLSCLGLDMDLRSGYTHICMAPSLIFFSSSQPAQRIMQRVGVGRPGINTRVCLSVDLCVLVTYEGTAW